MRRKFFRTALASALVITSSIAIHPVAQAEELAQPEIEKNTSVTQPELKDSEKILAIGDDGFVRTIDTKDSGNHGKGELRNDLNLAKGDQIILSEDQTEASLVDADGNLLGKFESPSIDVDGLVFKGVFRVEGHSLVTGLPVDSPIMQERGCWRATAATWTWRVSGGVMCGAVGVATVVGGVACGLAWAGAEDHMDIDGRAC